MSMAALALRATCTHSDFAGSTATPTTLALAMAPASEPVPSAQRASESAGAVKSEAAALALPPIERPAVHLVGMTTIQVERLLGQPRFVRHDGQAQIWRFANQSCVLDVFFYREPNGYTVRHYEMRSPGIGEAFARPCAGDVSVLLQAKSG
jgi:hypothetical protein